MVNDVSSGIDDGNDVVVADCDVNGRVPLLVSEVIAEDVVVRGRIDGNDVVVADFGVEVRVPLLAMQ